MVRGQRMNCPECEQELKEMEARSALMHPDHTQTVWVCVNKCCDNYDEIVFDEGDLDEEE
jgi:hypothetical protein